MCLQCFPYDLNKPGLIRKELSMVVPERRVWSGAGGEGALYVCSCLHNQYHTMKGWRSGSQSYVISWGRQTYALMPKVNLATLHT